jgi:hypothetical protein
VTKDADGPLRIEHDFVDTLARSPSLRDESSRELIAANIGRLLGAELNLRRQTTARMNIMELVRVCAGVPGGLDLLTDQLRFVDPLAPELPRLRQLCDEWHAAHQVNGNAPPQPASPPPLDLFYTLVDVLETVPCIRDEHTRTLLVSQLPPAIAGTVPYSPQRRIHAIHIARTCLANEGGLAELIAVIGHIEGPDSVPLRRLRAAVRQLPPEFTC